MTPFKFYLASKGRLFLILRLGSKYIFRQVRLDLTVSVSWPLMANLDSLTYICQTEPIIKGLLGFISLVHSDISNRLVFEL